MWPDAFVEPGVIWRKRSQRYGPSGVRATAGPITPSLWLCCPRKSSAVPLTRKHATPGVQRRSPRGSGLRLVDPGCHRRGPTFSADRVGTGLWFAAPLLPRGDSTCGQRVISDPFEINSKDVRVEAVATGCNCTGVAACRLLVARASWPCGGRPATASVASCPKQHAVTMSNAAMVQTVVAIAEQLGGSTAGEHGADIPWTQHRRYRRAVVRVFWVQRGSHQDVRALAAGSALRTLDALLERVSRLVRKSFVVWEA